MSDDPARRLWPSDDDDDDDTNDVDQLVGAALPSGAVSCTLHTRLLPI